MEDDFGLSTYTPDFGEPIPTSTASPGQSYGEAHVVQPELKGSAMNQYTTYLVQAKLGDDNFSSRKRYSDFEWLRCAFASIFPGFRIPPLPKKQSAAQGILAKTGRSNDEAFIESRRAGLEDFLRRCLQRKELCVDSKLLRGFLGTDSEEAVDEFKRKIENVSISGKCQKYAQIFASVMGANMPTEDRIPPFKLFLSGQTQQLRELADGFKEVVDAQGAVTKAVIGAQLKLALISGSEGATLESAGVGKEARCELVQGLRQQSKVMQASPASHYDLLFEAAERELLETEAMLEAVDSVERMQVDLLAAKEKAQTMDRALKLVMDGGEIPSTGTGVARMLGIAPKKDREDRIVAMKADLEQKKKDVVALEEFHQLAKRVLICREIDSFYKEKVTGHRQVKDAFAGLSQTTAERFVGIWGGAASGYPATADGLPEVDVEYE